MNRNTNHYKLIIAGALAGVIVAAALGLNEIRIYQASLLPGAQPYIWFVRLQFWLGAISTIAIYSFLYKENQFYRAFEHALLGSAAGMGTAVVVRQQLIDKWAVPVFSSCRSVFSQGFTPEIISGLLLIIPGIIGLLWYFQYSKKYFWISRIAFCITMGAGAGLAFKDKFNQLMPQIAETCKPVWVGSSFVRDASLANRIGMSIENIIFMTGTVTVLIYFFFVFSRKKLYIKAPASLGRWFLMIALGAFFGNTFMTRLSALIERVHFIIVEWLRLSSL